MAPTEKVVGLLGGGQLGRMFVEAANRANIRVNVVDAANAPAKQISSHDGHIEGSFANSEDVDKLSRTCDIMTIEIEHVDTYALEQAARRIPVEPSWKTVRLIQDKYAQKKHLVRCQVAVASFENAEEASSIELKRIGKLLKYPFMLKAKTQAYDGKGNYRVGEEAEIDDALKALQGKPLYAEQWAPFKKELAVMVVKTAAGTYAYPTVETVHEDSICKLVYAPARCVSEDVSRRAKDLAIRSVAGLEGKGVFGVEMFLLEDETLLVNEIAPRPHNSGHYTIEACVTSQYEAHLQAILDEPIDDSSLRQREPAVMLNILGGSKVDSHLDLVQLVKTTRGAKLHLYGKGDAKPGRKMGHITLTAPTMYEAEQAMQPLMEAADKIRANGLGQSHTPENSRPHAAPSVAVVTGSQSDQSVLKGCYDILQIFDIPYEPRILSAHRCPKEMAKWAESARGNGTRVIIAAAGGAAHLPGMLASHSDGLPVIGLPIQPSIGDGTDSILSILNMPSGCPVATIGLNKAANAALLAARIIGTFDDRVHQHVMEYRKGLGAQSMENDRLLRENH